MNIVVFCGSNDGVEKEKIESIKVLGKMIAESGNTLVCSGLNTGLAAAVADGALEAGGKVIGVVPAFKYFLEKKHSGITEFIDDAEDAQAKMREIGEAFIVYPGGIAHLSSIMNAIVESGVEENKAPIVFYDLDGFYKNLKVFFDDMKSKGCIRDSEYERILFSGDLEEIKGFIAG